MIRLLLPIVLLAFFQVSAQDQNLWTGHYSYNNVKDIAVGNGTIYASAENAFFTYNEFGELDKVSTVNGLSGKTITTSLFDQEGNRFLVGHEDGSMQVYLEDTEQIIQVVDIVEKVTISPEVKRINHFMEFGDFIYISTDFGISLYNLNDLEFDDTYFIGQGGAQVKVRQTTVFQDFIYAATDDGIYRAPVMNDNLIDFDQWERFQTSNWVAAKAFGSAVYFIASSRNVLRFDGASSSLVLQLPFPVTDVEANEEFMTVAMQQAVSVFDLSFNEVLRVDSFADFENVRYNSALLVENELYAGTTEYGMLRLSLGNPSMPEAILPQGPKRNFIFGMEQSPERLWVVYGAYDIFYNPFRLGGLNAFDINYLEEGSWETITFEEALNTRVLSKVTADPEDPTHVYISSFHDGLLELVDNTPVNLFNGENTPEIEDTDPGNPNNMDYRIGEGAFDNDGNFWFTVSQSLVASDLVVRRPNGSFVGFDADNALPQQNDGYGDMAIDRNNTVFFGSQVNGLIGFNEANSSENQFRNISEDAGLPSSDVRALAIDNRGQLWIGTARGLRVLFNTADFFDPESTPQPQQIIFLDDGEASELLFQQFITDIEVDGNNNKWIATADSGVFYVSSNGQETIFHFTADNSPLPSNTVNDIEIDGETGEVFIGTTSGLLAFQGNAINSNDDLSEVFAFPNPVRPGGEKVTISGLTARANVKITDIEGNLVFETTSQGGSVEWDLSAFGRHQVASGVYLVLVSTQEGEESTIKKVMVIR